MKLQSAIELKLRRQPLYIVVEAGFDIDDEPFANLTKCFSMPEAREVFIEKLKNFVCYEEPEEDDDDEEEDEPVPSFEEEYDENIYTGKYVDYDERYLLQIKEV